MLRSRLKSRQRAVIALDVLDILKEEARERRLAQLKQGDKTPVQEKFPERENGQARDKAADLLGTNGKKRLWKKYHKRLRAKPATKRRSCSAKQRKARERQAQAGASAAPGKKAPEKIPEVLTGDVRDKAPVREKIPELALAGTRPNTSGDLTQKVEGGQKGNLRQKIAEGQTGRLPTF